MIELMPPHYLQIGKDSCNYKSFGKSLVYTIINYIHTTILFRQLFVYNICIYTNVNKCQDLLPHLGLERIGGPKTA